MFIDEIFLAMNVCSPFQWHSIPIKKAKFEKLEKTSIDTIE
jgi:hypothetical protein